MAAFVWGDGGAQMTPETIAAQRKVAQAMMARGGDYSPIASPWQGVARVAEGLLGGYEAGQADAAEKRNAAAERELLASLIAGSGATTPAVSAPAAAPVMPTPSKPAVTPVEPPVTPAPASSPAVATVAAAAPSGVNPRLLTAMASPYISEGTKKVLGVMLQSQLKPADQTDDIKEFNIENSLRAKKGLPPLDSLVDMKAAIKKAGATNVTTNVDAKGEDAFAKAAGGAQAKRFDELAGEGQKARQMVADIETLNDLGTKIKTGKLAEAKAAIGPYAEALGVKVDGLNEIQAHEAIVNRLAPSLRVPGSGAQSDYELKNFLKSLPSLGNTPEGNAIASSVLKGLQDNKIRASDIASRALSGEIKREEAEKQLRELPDPMEGYRKFTKAGGGTPSPAKSSVPTEGQTATNPTTGEKVILRGGRWMPPQ